MTPLQTRPQPSKIKRPSKYLSVRFWAFQAHLWVGLLVVASFTMVGFSGSMLIIADWVDEWNNPGLHFVKPEGERRPFNELLATFRALVPSEKLTLVRPPADESRSWVFLYRVPIEAVKPAEGGADSETGPLNKPFSLREKVSRYSATDEGALRFALNQGKSQEHPLPGPPPDGEGVRSSRIIQRSQTGKQTSHDTGTTQTTEQDLDKRREELRQRRRQELEQTSQPQAAETAQPLDAGQRTDRQKSPPVQSAQPQQQARPVRREFTSHEVFINPYTGQVLGHRNATETRTFHTFFSKMHYYLLLPREPGYRLNGYLAIPTVLVLLTGLVLWWPSTLKLLYNRISIKFRAGYQRINWDTHNAVGIWSLPLLVIVMATGLYFPFALEVRPVFEDWFGKRSEPIRFETPERDPALGPAGLEEALKNVADKFPDATIQYVTGVDRGNMQVTVSQPINGMGYRNIVRIDRATGHVASIKTPQNFTDHLIKIIFPLHTGFYFGNTMRWVYFVLGLTPAVLSVTGIWIFASRKYKQLKAWRRDKPAKTADAEPGHLSLNPT